MAKKEDFLSSVCYRYYGRGTHAKPSFEQIRVSNYYDEVCRVYKDLGGVLELPPVNPGKWDIDMEYCIIELDEENHFNRYRLKTLESTIYEGYTNFDVEKYRKYCISYDKECPTTQKRWSNRSSDRQFGESGLNGDFSRNGPSRWKQRAFYDFIKDVYSIITGIPVIRISIYDQIEYSTIKQLLDKEDSIKVKEYLKARLTS